MINRKEKRQCLLRYFMTISEAQQQVQKIQNQLVQHLRFSPVALYLQILKGQRGLTSDRFSQYIANKTKIADHRIVNTYLKRYSLGQNITLKQFTTTLLPYTPQTLRSTTHKLQQIIETKHLDTVIEQDYHTLLKTELQQIKQIAVAQSQTSMDWQHMGSFMTKDLMEYAKKIDINVAGEIGILAVRAWMELWIPVEEKNILNIIRWVGGPDQSDLEHSHSLTSHAVKCTCSEPRKNGSMNHTRFDGSLSVSKKVNKLKKVKSSNQLLDPQARVKLFIRYLGTILKSERRLDILREILKPYRSQVEEILHNLTSKKHPHTKMSHIIAQLEKALGLKGQVLEMIQSQLQRTRVDNNFIFSLYRSSSPNKASKKKKTADKRLNGQQLYQQVMEVLYTFCLCKATLKSYAQQLEGRCGEVMERLTGQKDGELDQSDLSRILEQSKTSFKQKHLSILMAHLGQGSVLTAQSIEEVMELQTRQ